ncbi:gasdermin-E-like isoform X1 [Lates japonicus]|uniref:Gasdermin-E-like isoform X1 n=1 Tax=Lates japonicus TaxID=270547 RepID=A0AAD3MNR9_LATJO|nr:gasdermin-E-like isoform X1 [Lates japonicus]
MLNLLLDQYSRGVSVRPQSQSVSSFMDLLDESGSSSGLKDALHLFISAMDTLPDGVPVLLTSCSPETLRVLNQLVDGLKEGGLKEGGLKEGGLKEGGLKEGGLKEGGLKEGGLKEGGLKEGGLKEGGLKEGGLKEGGLKEGGLKEGGLTRLPQSLPPSLQEEGELRWVAELLCSTNQTLRELSEQWERPELPPGVLLEVLCLVLRGLSILQPGAESQ